MVNAGASRRCLTAMASGVLCAFTAIGSAQRPPFVLIVPIETRAFAQGGTLLVQIWNAAQLEALEKNQSCAITRNATTGTDTIRCPPGVIYQEISPEKFEFPVAAQGARVEIAPSQVRTGERFRIRVSGPNADGCNTTFGEQTSTAGSGSGMTVSLVWETTAKACSKGVVR